MASKQKILIVDDDNNIAELISLYLTKECYDTKIVNDGEEAVREFHSFQPNLILLDLMLPGMDGYQVCREIRHDSDVPIIMLSAKGEVFDKVLGLELGADDYIIKPFDSKELVARVKAVLRRFQPSRTIPVSATVGKCVSTRILSSTRRTIPSFTRAAPSICRRRNWSFSTSLLPHQTRSLRENSSSTISGAMSTSAIPAR